MRSRFSNESECGPAIKATRMPNCIAYGRTSTELIAYELLLRTIDSWI
jgi:hypothetical protein